MTSTQSGGFGESPWRGIDLEIYERHMSDPRVAQLQALHEITREQLAEYPVHSVAIVGVAGGNGLDLIDLTTTVAVYGYDLNPDYLEVCEARYRDVLGERLHLIETTVGSTLTIEPVDLVIANLVVEYIGVTEFVAFASANAERIGVVSCVVQRNDAMGFVSSTDYASSLAPLASVSTEVDPLALDSAFSRVGFLTARQSDHPLPNGKTLLRRDYRAR